MLGDKCLFETEHLEIVTIINEKDKKKKGRKIEGLASPVINAHGCEVQLVLGLKEEHFSSDLHDRRRLDGHSDGEQGELRLGARPVFPHDALAVEVLQSSLDFQSLERGKKKKKWKQLLF